jgi:hypothetical protein
MQSLVSDGVIQKIHKKDSRSLHVCFNPLQGSFVIELLREQPDLTDVVEKKIKLMCDDPNYCKFLKYYLKIVNESPLGFKE